MNLVPTPIKSPMSEIIGFKATRSKVRSALGLPHYVETDSLRTAGGEEDWWGFANEKGQRLFVKVKVPYEIVIVYSDPPNLKAVFNAFDALINMDALEVYVPVAKWRLAVHRLLRRFSSRNG